MIELTSLNAVPFVLNDQLIETIENIPETKITLTTGKYFLVSENREEIVKRVVAYNRRIFEKSITRETGGKSRRRSAAQTD